MFLGRHSAIGSAISSPDHRLIRLLLSTSLGPHCAVPSDVEVAVVIDVLRATSVMATALHAGAKEIVTFAAIEQARQFAELQATRPLLCGERECKRIDGFELGNSPADYTSDVVQNRTIAMTTTNGTQAIELVADVERVITASFLNLSAVVESVKTAGHLHLVCAGTNGEVTAEDVLLAGAIIEACLSLAEVELTDSSMIAHGLWHSLFGDAQPTSEALSQKLRETQGGRNLFKAGYESDFAKCADIDSLSVVPTRCLKSPPTFSLSNASC